MFLRTGPGQGRVRAAQRTPVAPALGVLAVFLRWPGEAADDDQGPAVAPATTRSWTGPAEDSALRLGAERRAGVVPGPGGESFIPAAR